MTEYSVWEQGSLHQNKGGGELRVRNTKPACPPTFGYFFISPISEEEKKRGKRDKKRTIQETFILLENSSMLHMSERETKEVRCGGGVLTYKFPRINISPLGSDLPSLSKPPVPPTHPCIITVPAFSQRSATSDRSQNCRSAGPRDWGGNLCCRRKKEFYVLRKE